MQTHINTETDIVIFHLFSSCCTSIKISGFGLLSTFKQVLKMHKIVRKNLIFVTVVLIYFQPLTILISDISYISTLQIVFFISLASVPLITFQHPVHFHFFSYYLFSSISHHFPGQQLYTLVSSNF